MTTPCAVLRCENPGEVPLELNKPGDPVLDTLVCREHEAQIEGGEHWAWSEQAQAVVLGTDLDDLAT
jgi:hypothetical protein